MPSAHSIGSVDATLAFTAGTSLTVDGIALNDGTVVEQASVMEVRLSRSADYIVEEVAARLAA